MASSHIHHGVVHGRTIELSDNPGLPDGQEVRVIVHPQTTAAVSGTPEERLQRAFGAWSDDADNLDEFLQWNRDQRGANRPEITP